MNELDKIYNALISLCSIVFTFLYGEFTGAMASLVTLSTIDYASGVMLAIKNHTLSSSIGFNGILRKIMVFLMVGIAHIVDRHIGSESLCRDAVIFFYLSNEGISILENAIGLGIPVPKILKEKLIEFRKENDGEE